MAPPLLSPRSRRPTLVGQGWRAWARMNRLERVLLACFAAIGITFAGGTVAGIQPSGYAWLFVLAITAPTVAMLRVPPAAWRPLRYYVLFLAFALVSLMWTTAWQFGVPTFVQLTVPVLAYLVAYRAAGSRTLLPALQLTSMVLLAVAAVLVLLVDVGLLSPRAVSIRPLAIAMAPLTVVALARLRSVAAVLLVGGAVTSVAMISGSRMASLALVLVIVTSPALAVDWRKRVAVLVLCAAAVGAITQTTAFQERFFHGAEGSVEDIVTFSERLNTAGRGELWPHLWELCGRSPVVGFGLGASYPLSLEFTDEAMPQPHNELLRTYCDTGLIGSGLFLLFVATASWRCWTAFRRHPHVRVHALAGQLLLVFVVFGATDNPLVYTAHFMVPMFLLFGLSIGQAVPLGAGRRSWPSVGDPGRGGIRATGRQR